MDLTLPLDYAAIERILPHRYPFLLVDRITELELDKRIVGIKNVSLNERHLWLGGDGSPVLPPTILTEAIAQVGAIMILAKPENRQQLPFFAGIKRVRYRRPVQPATSSKSRPPSSACAAAWDGSKASRASTASPSSSARWPLRWENPRHLDLGLRGFQGLMGFDWDLIAIIVQS